MKKKLKIKILAGFMLLVALLIAAGAVSILEFIKLSNSVTALIQDNYKTIESTKTMLESLERTDSGVLLLLLGEREEGKRIISSANESFEKAFAVARNNITETDEDSFVSGISEKYASFKAKLNETMDDRTKASDVAWYHSEVYSSFLNVKHAVDALMSLNQSSMYEEATILKQKAHRAIMPGIVAIVGAVVFSLLLSFFISKYFVSPLSGLADAIRSFHPREKQLRSNIRSEDEIQKLEFEVNNLIARLVKYQEEQK